MSLVDDYTALREGAAIGALAERAQIALKGQDRATYLQGLLTNDIPAVPPGSGCYSAWLTAQGRMITDLHVFASADMLLLDVPAALVDALQQRLDQFIFTEDVQIVPLAGELSSVWVHGPQAASVVERVTGESNLAGWPGYRHEPLTHDGSPVVVARVDQLGVPGFCLYVAPAQAAALTDALVAAGARIVGRGALEAARIEAGYPVFGVDMTQETIPLEAGIEQRAISFSKGCYVGQEVIIRVLHRGGGRVARRLVGLRIDQGVQGVPVSRAVIRAGQKEIGFVTSAALSPAIGSVALGYVHRDYVEPGTSVTVDIGGSSVPATVTARPIPRAA